MVACVIMDVTMDVVMDAYVIMNVIMDVTMDVIMIMDVIMVYNGVIMGIRDTLFAIITFVIMVYNGVIMENWFADEQDPAVRSLMSARASEPWACRRHNFKLTTTQ
jgi:hypothetical protein